MLAIRDILVLTDFSASAGKALESALAVAHEHEANVHLLHVLVPHVNPLQRMLKLKAEILTELETEARRRMHQDLDQYDLGKLHAEIVVRQAPSPTPAILEYARAHNLDLLVMGSHGQGDETAFEVGSTAERVVRRAPCPVLTVPKEASLAAASEPCFLAPFDLSQHSERALAHAVELAREAGAHLDIVHIVDYRPLSSIYGAVGAAVPDAVPDIESSLVEEMKQVADRVRAEGIDATAHVEHGPPAAYIIDAVAQRDIDLIVQASHGRTGMKRFLLGSTAERVLREAACPVLTIKSFGKSLYPEPPSSDRSADRDK